MLNVVDKKKYVLHISALKFYLQQGLSLRKVHRAMSFKQANFLKPFIEFNTEKRNNAKNDFDKDLFKLMNNSVYGKTMENPTNNTFAKTVLIIFNIFTFFLFGLLSVLAWVFFNKN